MVINGYNSDDYRYFEDSKTKKIIRVRNDNMWRYLFKHSFLLDIFSASEDFEFKKYPIDKAFDFNEYMKMQDDIVFKYTQYFYAHFTEGDVLPLTEWIKSKINSTQLISRFTGTTIDSYNKERLQYVEGDELSVMSKVQQLGDGSNNESGSLLESFKENTPAFLFNSSIKFLIPYKKGEVWKFTNNDFLVLFVDQAELKYFLEAREIVGKEKEKIFEEEYKDNILNTTIRYYKVKDGVAIDDSVCGVYKEVCKYNQNNFNSDGTIKTFFVEYGDYFTLDHEKEILKIADRLSFEEANKCHYEDRIATLRHKQEVAADKYVKEHKSRYYKGTNRLLTPLEFMKKEQSYEKRPLAKRLVKAINVLKDKKANS